MRTRWEYLVVGFEHQTREIGDGRHEYTDTYTICRHGTHADVRTGTSWSDVCNELGGEGWELADSSVRSSTVLPSRNGYPEVSFPLTIWYTFKRRVDERVPR